MGREGSSGSKGSAGCGCFLLVGVLVVWGICYALFPKLPRYGEVMERGEPVSGEVTRVETIENVTLNGKKPQRVVYSYGDGKTGSMMMALGESASEGNSIEVRVLGDYAYPEGIDPLIRPRWLNYGLLFFAAVGLMSFVAGLLRLLLMGGALVVAGKLLTKGKGGGSQTPPPPPPPPSSPPPPPA